jgi:hypothetical protein
MLWLFVQISHNRGEDGVFGELKTNNLVALAFRTDFSQRREGGGFGAVMTNNLDALILRADFSPGIPAVAGLTVITVPMGFYLANDTGTKSRNWGLVTEGPNIPSVCPSNINVSTKN